MKTIKNLRVVTNVQGEPNAFFIEKLFTDGTSELQKTTQATMLQDMATVQG